MTGKKVNNILKLNAKHALYFHQGDWYHHLKSFPGILVDSSGYVEFKTKDDYLNSKYL